MQHRWYSVGAGSAEWRQSARACQTSRSIRSRQNEPLQRPWAADRYLPSDLADGDFQSTASLSCTTASLACKEGRSLFYGSGKQRILSPLGLAIWACQMTVTVTWTATVLRGVASQPVELATPRAVSPCPARYCWLVCVLLSELALSHFARGAQLSE